MLQKKKNYSGQSLTPGMSSLLSARSGAGVGSEASSVLSSVRRRRRRRRGSTQHV